MAGQLHHAAITSAAFEDTVRFFEEVFQMEVSRTTGAAPERVPGGMTISASR